MVTATSYIQSSCRYGSCHYARITHNLTPECSCCATSHGQHCAALVLCRLFEALCIMASDKYNCRLFQHIST